MPEYVYMCSNKHETIVTHAVMESPQIVCAACGLNMWRKPQLFVVNWGGLRPSQGELSPAIANHIRDVDHNRDLADEKYGG